jgi:predicted  nucleic acid-binding Zn-ribbon protein
MTSRLDSLKDIEMKLESKICKLMIKQEKLAKELKDITDQLNGLTDESDKVFEEIKVLEKLGG